jgi:hypothetical protein
MLETEAVTFFVLHDFTTQKEAIHFTLAPAHTSLPAYTQHTVRSSSGTPEGLSGSSCALTISGATSQFS